MARRSPLNRRYQKDTKVGSTRKSAAAAKPKRSSGESPSSGTQKSKGRSSSARPSSRIQLPPEIKKLQRISFGMLGVAVALSILYLLKFRTPSTAGYVIIGVAYALMFVALFIDFTRVRPTIKAIQKGKAPPQPRSAAGKPPRADGRKDRSASRLFGLSRQKVEPPPEEKNDSDQEQ
jgi:hypothetical protein